MAETGTDIADEAAAAGSGGTAAAAEAGAADRLPDGLTREVKKDGCVFRVAPGLKVTDAQSVRHALLKALKAEVTAGHPVRVVSEPGDADGVVGVPALQLSLAGQRFVESRDARPARRSNGAQQVKSERGKPVAQSGKAVAP
ncbi:MAG: hypothetical protein AAFP17_17110 [Pseudomonadota bacterium]